MANTDATALTALPFLPERATLETLRDAARSCQGCPLYKNATQTVFGEGPKSARVMLIGEQPGNDEDLAGHPFVGPSGRVLDEGLQSAGIERSDVYVTNVVKHFKWEPKGKRRLHQKPNAREIGACVPWLYKEIDLIKPQLIILLGATASQAVLGPKFKVTAQRGQALTTNLADYAVATVHPSAILRQPTSEAREQEMARFTADLRTAAGLLENGAATRKAA